VKPSALTGALLLAAVTIAARAAEQQLGRLFYTPAQRAALEDARRRNIKTEALSAEATRKPREPKPQELIVNGVLLRSDGQSIAWINGKPTEGDAGEGLRVRHTSRANEVLVYDADKGQTVEVKVGQHVNLSTGGIEESYKRRTPVRAGDKAPGAGVDDKAEPQQPSKAEKPRARRRASEPAAAPGGPGDAGGG
jgi:hypothetical protein